MYNLIALRKSNGKYRLCNGRRVYGLYYNLKFISYIIANTHHRWSEYFGGGVWFMGKDSKRYQYANLNELCYDFNYKQQTV